MECNEVQQLFTDLAEGTLDAGTRSAVEAHIAGCPACAKEWEETVWLFSAIAQTPVVMPPPTLRTHFNEMLEAERRSLAAQPPAPAPAHLPARRHIAAIIWQVAAACLLLVTGIWIGSRINKAPDPGNLAKLETEVKNLHETLMIAMLDNESASERLKAVNYAETLNTPNTKVIAALFNTLDNDKNVNVRLAALYSLARFADSAEVRDALVASLNKQTEPIIQVVLINLLAEKKETRAIPSIRRILSNEKTLKEVKEAAQKGLQAL
jgi:hypothetical protein